MTAPLGGETARAPPPASSADPAQFREIDVAVVLPTLNEEEGLARTLEDIPFAKLEEVGWRVRPLVIDGGSTDATLRVAAERRIPALLQTGRGKGAAIREALQWLRDQGVRYAVVLDADCTYPGVAIAPVLSLLASGSDLVVGVRYPVRTPLLGPRDLVHRVGNALLNFTASELSQHPILDLCSGFWGVDLALGLEVGLESEGFDIEAELFLRAYRQGLTVTQIPISYRERVGVAKLRAFRDGARILLTILRCGRLPFSTAGARPTPPDGRWLRELLAICFVHGAEQLVVLGPPTRRSDAETLVARLRGCGIAPTVMLGASDVGTLEGIRANLREVSASAYPPPVVALRPIPGEAVDGPASAVALLPRTRRIVYVGPSEPPRSVIGSRRPWIPRAPEEGPSSPSFLLEFRSDRRTYLGPLKALGASLGGSMASKEAVLLGANGLRASVSIWRERTSSRVLPPSGLVDWLTDAESRSWASSGPSEPSSPLGTDSA